MSVRRGLAPSLLVLAACSTPPAPAPAPAQSAAFPADYVDSYSLVRDCRKSGDHELDFIRVLVDPDAVGPYTDRTTPFPDGAVVLKEQYDVSDTDCSGPIVQWTVMVKDSAATSRLRWDWQRVAKNRSVTEANTARCFGCHEGCTGTPDVGYDFTCTEP